MPLRIVLLALITLIVAVAAFQAPWGPVSEALFSADPMWLAVAIGANLAVFPAWAVQWRLLPLIPGTVSLPAMLQIVALSSIASSLLSSAAGVASSAVLLVTRGRMTAVAAASLLTVDQLLVGFAKVFVLAIAVCLAPLPDSLTGAGVASAVLVAGLWLLVLVLAHFPHRIRQFTAPRRSAIAKAGEVVAGIAEHLEVLRRPGRASMVFCLALLKKGAEVAAALAIQLACGIEPTLAGALLVVAAVGITTAVPVVPGNFGVYTATVFSVYGLLGVPAGPALAAGLLQHAVDLVPSLLLGCGTLLGTRLSDRRTTISDNPKR